MGFQKFGIGEILPDGVIQSLSSLKAKFTSQDREALEAELALDDEEDE